MGCKLVRDFVPGRMLRDGCPLKGRIRVADQAERGRLGARKVLEDAQELCEIIDANGPMSDIRREIGDVLQAILYVGQQFGIPPGKAAMEKAATHGKFTQHFVWEWEDDPKHDPLNTDCPWNRPAMPNHNVECTCSDPK